MIMIHSCNPRLWYVKNFLIPALKAQGFTDSDIVLFNDDKMCGNLNSFLNSCIYVAEHFDRSDGIWHLQDDVMLCSDFADRLKLYPRKIVCNGFVSKMCSRGELEYVDYQDVKKYWMSFPCVYIPNRHIHGFLDWFHAKCIVAGAWSKAVSENKYDDFFFWTYMKERHSNEPIYNIKPSLVQHIDYMLSGSVTNKHRHAKALAYYWPEKETEKELELERRIKEWQDRELK